MSLLQHLKHNSSLVVLELQYHGLLATFRPFLNVALGSPAQAGPLLAVEQSAMSSRGE